MPESEAPVTPRTPDVPATTPNTSETPEKSSNQETPTPSISVTSEVPVTSDTPMKTNTPDTPQDRFRHYSPQNDNNIYVQHNQNSAMPATAESQNKGLPQTGNQQSTLSKMAGLLIMTFLGLIGVKKKRA